MLRNIFGSSLHADLRSFKRLSTVKEYYDGYKFYDKEMFCPWDVINFIEDSYKKNLKGTLDLSNIQNYWSGSTSSPDTKLNRLEQEKLDEDIVIKALKAHKLL